jgi:hypothetical protein
LSGWVVFRASAVAAAACAALALGLPAASGGSAAVAARIFCGPFPDSSTHWEAVLGHRSSVAEAILLRRQLESHAIKGVQLEKDYCDDVELAIPGLDSPSERDAFFFEARASGVVTSFEPPDNQKSNGPGQVTAVFGHRPTLKRASDLLLDVANKGWREDDIVRVSSHDWKVVLRRVPASGEADLAAEARSGGYSVTFEG